MHLGTVGHGEWTEQHRRISLRPSLASVPVVQLSLPGFDGRRGSELARQCLEERTLSVRLLISAQLKRTSFP